MEIIKVPISPDTPLEPQIFDEVLELVKPYYIDPDHVLESSLKNRNEILITKKDNKIGSFLIVNHNHMHLNIDKILHRFTYLGLGCAKTCPMPPLFLYAKAELTKELGSGDVGVIHLLSASPYVYRSIEKAFKVHIYPSQEKEQNTRSHKVAAELRNTYLPSDDIDHANLFLLRKFNQKHKYTKLEGERISNFQGYTPFIKEKIDYRNGDRLIIFHNYQ